MSPSDCVLSAFWNVSTSVSTLEVSLTVSGGARAALSGGPVPASGTEDPEGLQGDVSGMAANGDPSAPLLGIRVAS